MKNGPKCLQCKKPITAAFYKHPAGPVHAEGSCHDGASRRVVCAHWIVDHPQTAWHGASWIEGLGWVQSSSGLREVETSPV